MEQWLASAWNWIGSNSKALSTFISLGTLFVWLFYAQLLFAGFKRQRQARILINQGWGRELNSVCLIANMSHEPIYIQCIIIILQSDQGEYRSSVTDLETANTPDERKRTGDITRQGPLLSGSQMNLGTFQALIRQAARHHELTCDDNPGSEIGLQAVTVTVISSYGPEGGVIGTQREFTVSGENRDQMVPSSIDSRRLVNRQARRKMRRWLAESV